MFLLWSKVHKGKLYQYNCSNACMIMLEFLYEEESSFHLLFDSVSNLYIKSVLDLQRKD